MKKGPKTIYQLEEPALEEIDVHKHRRDLSSFLEEMGETYLKGETILSVIPEKTSQRRRKI